MKNANTAPAYRLWTPTGDAFPAVGASAVGFGKAMTDVDSKWFNKDAWRMESFVKRDKTSAFWVDPAASKDSKKASVQATFGYDDVARNLKYRGITDDSLNHTSELAYTLPLQDGEQRVKVTMKTKLDSATFLPKTDDVETKIFWKAMLPALTAEAIVKQTKEGADSVNAWVQGEVSDDIAYGGLVSYSLKKNAVALWEAGLLNTFSIGSGVTATRAVVRDAEYIELGILRPPVEVAGKKVSVYVKANHTLSSGKTDLAVSTSTQVCPKFEFKARFAYQGLKDLATSFAAVWAAPGGWKIAASIAQPGAPDQKFGLRMASGSTPAPL